MRDQEDLKRDVAARVKAQREQAAKLRRDAAEHQKEAKARAMVRMRVGRDRARRQAQRSRLAARRAQLVRKLRFLAR